MVFSLLILQEVVNFAIELNVYLLCKGLFPIKSQIIRLVFPIVQTVTIDVPYL